MHMFLFRYFNIIIKIIPKNENGMAKNSKTTTCNTEIFKKQKAACSSVEKKAFFYWISKNNKLISSAGL